MTLRRMVIELVAEAPASFSQRAATEGAHRTLEGPTGAALMGWAAGRCYDDLAAQAFAVFHSGRVHFSDAVRIVDGTEVFPAPTSLLRPKHGTGRICLGPLAYAEEHHRSGDARARPAAEAVKGMYMSVDGSLVRRVDRRLRLRSAISRKHRAAEDGMLFGTEALNARGATYRAVIECDADLLDADAWAILESAFCGNLALGRARRSGYGGQYRVRKLPEGDDPFQAPALEGIEIGEIARFWLLSDAQFTDAWGQPRLVPEQSDFGLSPKDWELVPTETSIATRRVMPWNGMYGSRDMEVAVVEAGSIIAFRRKASSSEMAALPRLLGTGHQRGYGRYCVISRAVSLDDLGTSANAPEPLAKEGWEALSAKHVDHAALLNWLGSGDVGETGSEDPSWTQARINEGRSKIDLMNGEHPGPSQWGELLELVDSWVSETADFSKNLAKRLERDCWDRWYSGLGDWVKTSLFSSPDELVTRQQRARAIERVIKALRQYRPSDAAFTVKSGQQGER